MSKNELTGNTRLNTVKIPHWFSPDEEYVIIEVEVSYAEGFPDMYGMPTHLAYKGWRPATPLDWVRITEMGRGMNGNNK